MIVVYDLETLKDFFLYVDIDLDNNFHVFEISKFKDQSAELRKHIRTLKAQIGFNNLGFDAQVQQYFLGLPVDTKDLAGVLHDYSDKLIERINKERSFPDYWERDLAVRQVDLFKIWHFDNEARKTSLKWIQYMTDWHNIEDMPYDHTRTVDTREDADMIIDYCKNDCLSTKHFYNITKGDTELILYKGKDKLQLRKDVGKEFGFKPTNFSDVKIGDQINKVNYMKATGYDYYKIKDLKLGAVRRSFTFGECFPSYTHFDTPEMNALMDRIRDIKVNVTEKQEYPFKFDDVKYTFAKGGLHSNDWQRIIAPGNNQILRDADVGSMYPNAIRKRGLYPAHLGPKWLEGYTSIIQMRLDAKKKYKETKDKRYESIQEAFKLALNGGSFGKLGEPSNWQYDPKAGNSVTIGCQIDLLMLIEDLVMSGIKIISANTDGVLCLFDRSQEDHYYKICKDWEKEVGNADLGVLEFCDYQLFAQRSVNDYIALLTEDSAKKSGKDVKQKGKSFSTEHELNRNKSFKIIPIALNEYFTKGISPRFTITNHKNIMDFCCGLRTTGQWFLEARGTYKGDFIKKRLQKTNRYYISNQGFKLYKCNPDGREIQPNSGKWLATIFNKIKEKEDYDINYDYYVSKVYEIIREIQPEVSAENCKQLSLF